MASTDKNKHFQLAGGCTSALSLLGSIFARHLVPTVCGISGSSRCSPHRSAAVSILSFFLSLSSFCCRVLTLLRRYVSTGNSLVFLGGFATIGLLNDVFGFRLSAEVYQARRAEKRRTRRRR